MNAAFSFSVNFITLTPFSFAHSISPRRSSLISGHWLSRTGSGIFATLFLYLIICPFMFICLHQNCLAAGPGFSGQTLISRLRWAGHIFEPVIYKPPAVGGPYFQCHISS